MSEYRTARGVMKDIAKCYMKLGKYLYELDCMYKNESRKEVKKKKDFTCQGARIVSDV